MKVTRVEDLKNVALQRGASVRFTNGDRFNTGKAEVDPVEKPLPVLAPKAPGLPATEPAADTKLLADQLRINTAVVDVLQQIAAAGAARQVVTAWEFDVVRDEDHRLKKIIARPVI